MFNKVSIKDKLSNILESVIESTFLVFGLSVNAEETNESSIDEVTMKRVVRGGKIVKKVKVKKKGFKVLRTGNAVKFVRMTQKEKRGRRKAARMAWKVGKGSRKNKTKRTMVRSKVRMHQLYGK